MGFFTPGTGKIRGMCHAHMRLYASIGNSTINRLREKSLIIDGWEVAPEPPQPEELPPDRLGRGGLNSIKRAEPKQYEFFTMWAEENVDHTGDKSMRSKYQEFLEWLQKLETTSTPMSYRSFCRYVNHLRDGTMQSTTTQESEQKTTEK